MDQGWAAFMGAIAGAIAGGLFVLLGAVLSHHLMAKNTARCTALSIRAEMTAILDILELRGYLAIMDSYIDDLKKKKRPDVSVPLIRQNYFTVFEQNGLVIGSLCPEVSTSIARFYTYAKAFIEDCNGAENDDFARYSDIELLELFEESKRLLTTVNQEGRSTSARILKLYAG